MEEAFSMMRLQKEHISVSDSLDRVLADDILSASDVPEFRRSTVDGYAVSSFDTHGSSESVPVLLNLSGEVRMGERTQIRISSGQTAYVPTGGMIPEGADSVVMIEHTNNLDESSIEVFRPVSSGENIIYEGDDIKKGEIILKRGRSINATDTGVLAAIGRMSVDVLKKLRFYIISTGDEIVEPEAEPAFGMIRDINGSTLSSLVKKAGCEVMSRVIVKDSFELLKKELQKALSISDIILISGGSSVGAKDFTPEVINSFSGRGVFVHGVAIKPGKPTIIGEIENRAVFGLPGHPVSAVIVFKVFVEHLIKHLYGISGNISVRRAVLSSNVPSSPGSMTFRMVSLSERDGILYADVNYGKSGLISLLSKSDGYLVINEHEEGLNSGEEVEIYCL